MQMNEGEYETTEARKVGAFHAKEYELGEAASKNPYGSTSPLCKQYWAGYLSCRRREGSTEGLFEEARELGEEWWDSLDTLECLCQFVPFPGGSRLFRSFLEGYYYQDDAYRESRFDVLDEIGEDWCPPKQLIQDWIDWIDKTDWKNRFFETLRSDNDRPKSPVLYKFRSMDTEADIRRLVVDIIAKRELWFSRTPDLNDPGEFKILVMNDLPPLDKVSSSSLWDQAECQLDRTWVPREARLELIEAMREV